MPALYETAMSATVGGLSRGGKTCFGNINCFSFNSISLLMYDRTPAVTGATWHKKYCRLEILKNPYTGRS